MCGIVGALGGELPRILAGSDASVKGNWGGGAAAVSLGAAGQRALDALARRGPDGCGAWADVDAGVWIGHTRLAIIDRSAAGAQPMRSASGRWVIALNGEIYNHRELRARVESAGVDGGAGVVASSGSAGGTPRRSPADWRGHSDSESLVEHIDAFGLEATLNAVEGMFSLAAWDAAERTLHLVRDPLGQKPLYWGWVGGGAWTGGGRAMGESGGSRASLVFASQLSAIEAMPGFERSVDPAAVAALMRWQCVPGDMCIYKGLHKLCPGHRLSARVGERPSVSAWWSLGNMIMAGANERLAPLHTPAARADALAHTAAAIREAVRSQLEADVPLGVLLSGGVDSSLVLALAQEHGRDSGDGPVHAFTVGFADADGAARSHDESEQAAAVAGALGARHHVLQATKASALAIVPSLAGIYDEPFADSSQVPTAIVARLARQHVGVALTGDGGDEMFGGYRRHWAAAHVWPVASAIPGPMRAMLARIAVWRTRRDDAAMPRAQAAHKLAQVLEASRIEDAHWSLASSWRQEWLLAGASRPAPPDWSAHAWWAALTPAERSIALDTLHYLPDDILVKVDRAVMHAGLETRAPLLDTRVVAAAWRLPLEVRMGRRGKHVLRMMLSEHLPEKLIDRPKHGFSAPIEQWLRGALREWAESLLRPAALEVDGFDAPVVRGNWDAMLAGRRDARDIWTVLMYRAWRERAS